MDNNPLEEVHPRVFGRRKLIFRIILFFSIISFAVLTLLAKYNKYFESDLTISRFVQTINFVGFDQFMLLLSLIGNAPISVFITFATFTFFLIIKKRFDAFIILLSSFGSILLSHFFKFLIDRPRPDPNLVLQLVTPETTPSFPSGHVLFYIGFFGVLLFLAYSELKMSQLRHFLIVAFGIMMFAIGVSRIYVGAHWFSDVLGSYFIGTIWLYIVVSFYKRYST